MEDISFGTHSHDDIQLYHDTQALGASSQEKIEEMQLRFSIENIEIDMTKQRNKMASNLKKLIMADTSHMDEYQKNEHQRALTSFTDQLFGQK